MIGDDAHLFDCMAFCYPSTISNCSSYTYVNKC